MKLVLRYINYLCLIPFMMALSTVFVIDNELANGTVSGKYFWFYTSMAWVTAGTIISFFISRKSVYLNITDFLLILFGITGLLSSYLQNNTINTRFILFVLCFVLYFYFRFILSGYKSNRYILLLFLLITGLIEAIWGLRQLYGFSNSQHNLFKLTGSFFNPGPYAGYLALIAPIAFYYLINYYKVFRHRLSKRFLSYYIYWAVSLLTLLCILLSLPAAMSRASWLASVGGCVFIGIVWLSKRRKLSHLVRNYKKKLILSLPVIVLALIIAGFGIYQLKKNSADGRALMWKVATLTSLDHLAGVGLGNFSGSYGDEQASYFASGQATEQEEFVAGAPEYAFNEYLQIAIELGIFPFILYLAIVTGTLYFAVKQKRIAEAGALVSLSVFAFMSYPYSILPFVIVLVFLLASCSASNKGQLVAGKIVTGIFICCLAVLVPICVLNRYPTHEAYTDWQELKMLYNMKLYKEVASDYEELAPYLNDQSAFMFEYSQSLSKTGEYEKSNDIIRQATRISSDPMFYNIMGKNYQALHRYDSAEISFRKAANIIPNRIYPYYLLANMYMEAGDTLKARKTAYIVLAKEPKTHSMAVEEMRKEMRKITGDIPH
ncbi:O-antigen ligase family protein [Viscerimonas tarda]